MTITLPDAGTRFISMQVIDEDQYAPAVIYGSGRHTFTKEQIGTRYMIVAFRILVIPADPKDMAAGRTPYRMQIKIEQPGGPGQFEMPDWAHASQDKIRTALVELGNSRDRHPACLWRQGRSRSGAAPHRPPRPHGVAIRHKDAIYLNFTPAKNDGKTVYRLQRRMCRSTASGRSASITPRAISRRTTSTPIR